MVELIENTKTHRYDVIQDDKIIMTVSKAKGNAILEFIKALDDNCSFEKYIFVKCSKCNQLLTIDETERLESMDILLHILPCTNCNHYSYWRKNSNRKVKKEIDGDANE